ncbi:MAG: hypothetical protein WBW62_11560 [Solirubrobacterales bacterium]
MNKRILLWAAAAVGGLLAIAIIPAGASATTNPDSAAKTVQKRLSTGIASITPAVADAGGATVSRKRGRKPVRKMTKVRAKNNATQLARYIFDDPEMYWTDYGVGACKRYSRPRVDCYSYVAEDVYDEYGYYLDTILCDWFTASAYLRSGKMKVWTYARECVLLSDV